jgi:hypothetical protein
MLFHAVPCCAFTHCRNYLAEDEDAPFDGSLLAADKRCFGAFQLRYGSALSRTLYTRLLLAGSQLGEGEEEEEA